VVGIGLDRNRLTFIYHESAAIDQSYDTPLLPRSLSLFLAQTSTGFGSHDTTVAVHEEDYILALVHCLFNSLFDQIDIRLEILQRRLRAIAG
jgi:hypothetical protein